MKRNTFLALGVLIIVVVFQFVAPRRVLVSHAATAPQTRNGTTAAPMVREIDAEGLKKILQRGPNESRPLLINFWATWCEPCRDEFPDLVRIDADYKGRGLQFVTVSLDDLADLKTGVRQFLRTAQAKMPTYLLNVPDPEPAIKSVDQAWGGSLPATFLFDSKGQIVFKHTGRIKADELRTVLDKTLNVAR